MWRHEREETGSICFEMYCQEMYYLEMYCQEAYCWTGKTPSLRMSAVPLRLFLLLHGTVPQILLAQYLSG